MSDASTIECATFNTEEGELPGQLKVMKGKHHRNRSVSLMRATQSKESS